MLNRNLKSKNHRSNGFNWYYLVFLLFILITISCKNEKSFDVLIIGDGTGAIAAGIQSSRSGANTILLTSLPWLGGMLTSAGVSAIDGNHELPAGLWGEFRDSIYAYYGGPEEVFTGWVSKTQFQPYIGNQIFQNLAKQESKLTIINYEKIIGIQKKSNKWEIIMHDPDQRNYKLTSQVLVDGTDLGDIAALAGVEYDIGMENKDEANEILGFDGPGVIQDLTYTAILEEVDSSERKFVQRSKDYDPALFYCTCEKLCNDPDFEAHPCDLMLNYALLPNNKYLINWPIFGNDYYTNVIEKSNEVRNSEYEKAKQKTRDFIYFIQNELGYKNLRISDNEFPSEDLFPLMPYHREGRRIKGLIRYTSKHIKNPEEYNLFKTGIAVGNYPIDHHHKERNDIPELDFPPIPSYSLPLGTLIPENVDNFLIADKAISVSNIANGTTRLQPVILQVGQVAGLVAAVSAQTNQTPKALDIRSIQDSILNFGGYISPFKDVEKNNPIFKSAQRIAACGLIDLEEKPYKWANETLFHPGKLMSISEGVDRLSRFYDMSFNKLKSENDNFKIIHLAQIIFEISKSSISTEEILRSLEEIRKQDLSEVHLTRLEYVYLIDKYLDPFHFKGVNFQGDWVYKNISQ